MAEILTITDKEYNTLCISHNQGNIIVSIVIEQLSVISFDLKRSEVIELRKAIDLVLFDI